MLTLMITILKVTISKIIISKQSEDLFKYKLS